MRGTGKVFPYPGLMVVGRGAVEVHVGEPIGPDEYEDMSLKELSAEVRERIGKLADMPLR